MHAHPQAYLAEEVRLLPEVGKLHLIDRLASRSEGRVQGALGRGGAAQQELKAVRVDSPAGWWYVCGGGEGTTAPRTKSAKCYWERHVW